MSFILCMFRKLHVILVLSSMVLCLIVTTVGSDLDTTITVLCLIATSIRLLLLLFGKYRLCSIDFQPFRRKSLAFGFVSSFFLGGSRNELVMNLISWAFSLLLLQ
ncbi:hypothetical protein VPH35_134823 [Triticum aestivum]|uniref:Uncharacterized protein n=2 Tax=Aegilops tauschii subsp. strangulata TaxID=200361 RepID=A0A453QKI4_AEGTS